jgi:hypothetical protein
VALFAESVEHLQPGFGRVAIDPELSTFLTASERLQEAATVEACVSRAVVGELDPSGELAISRTRNFRPWLPGLAWYLQEHGRFDSCGEDELRAMATAVRRTLAVGWLYACTPQARFIGTRTERAIWTAWAPSAINGSTLDDVIPEKKLADKIRNDGAELFRGELRAAGVVGRRGRLKIEMIGTHIATLGILLRMVQTNEISDDVFEITPPQTREADDPGRWAWERYPAEIPL